LQRFAAINLENEMLFTVTVNVGDCGYFEFSTESLYQLAEFAQKMGNTDVVDEDEDFEEEEEFFGIPDELLQYFDDSETYCYDEEAGLYKWYDNEHDAWYQLDEETGDWILIE